jgi:general secretion pathway protein F
MTTTFRYKPLSAEKSANLFFQLAQLEKTGVPANKAFGLIADTDAVLKKRLYAVQRYLEAGLSIADAGFKVGVFNEIQRSLIHAAESGGTLAAVYRRMADYYAARATRLRKIKSRCYYPAILLTISLFTQPLPALVAGSITETQYLQLSVGRLTVIILTVYIVLRLPAALSRVGLKPVIDRLLLQLPFVAEWITKRQLNDFYLNLALALAAGLSYAEALPKLVASIPNSGIRAQFRPALAKANSGESATDILSTVSSIRGTTAIQIIHSCEHSGRLAEGLQHFAQLEADDLHLQDDMLAEWLPRLVYAGVVIWIARSLIGF